ncbi:hypothetical protein [Campylobacter estrildidarum]|uniref:EF-hand domain-containing protein n=1 Tax=Campylobacter estrildidarum TaxID=2510189 RepID=A0A4U7BMU2_9BACT|nr:hypothetical protein [Campylobacter estrildidarum]TKX31535.1 hypothetical protein CQA69_02645 [Campylobacter estrildidarum]
MEKLTMNSLNALSNNQNITNRKEILELKAEEKDKVKVNDLSDDSNSGKKVVFEDKEGELISLNLSEENYKSLQNHFGSYANYIARDDGSIRLNGEANEFISNWFENAKNEFFSIKSTQSNERINISFHQNTLHESMQNLGLKHSDLISDDASIEEKLNFFINKDVNKDGNIDDSDVKEPSFREILGDLKEASGGGANAMQSVDPQKIQKKDDDKAKIKEKENDDEDLLQKAQEKGLNSLSADEQAKLKASNPKEFEELQNKSLDELAKNLSKDLMQQISDNEAIFVDKRV